MQDFKEGNACWNCKYINTCKPIYRPLSPCVRYEPLGKSVSHQTISEWLGVNRLQTEYIIKRYGADKIVELLAVRGYIVRYEFIGEYRRFYLLNNNQKNAR